MSNEELLAHCAKVKIKKVDADPTKPETQPDQPQEHEVSQREEQENINTQNHTEARDELENDLRDDDSEIEKSPM